MIDSRQTMKVGSLFSGAGCGDLGLEWAGFEHAWFCEVKEYARQILAMRWPRARQRFQNQVTKMDNIIQIAILIFSSASIWAFAGTKYKRLGFICGLCGQPFWIYTTFTAGQWGMFAVSLWFTGNHIRGLWNHRTKPKCKHDWRFIQGMGAGWEECSKCGAKSQDF